MLFLRIIAPIVVFVTAVIKEFLSESLKTSTKLKIGLFIIMLIALGVSIFTSIMENSNSITQQKSLKSKNDSLLLSITQLKANNDSLMILVTQLKANEDQKNNISERALKHQIYSAGPFITIDDIKITDEKYLTDSIYAPKVITTFTNTGKRAAYSLSYRIWVVPYDYSVLRAIDPIFSAEATVAPDHQCDVTFLPKLKKKILPIYCCFEVKYYDKETRKRECQTFFYKYERIREVEEFGNCDTGSVRKLVALINMYNKPLIKP